VRPLCVLPLRGVSFAPRAWRRLFLTTAWRVLLCPAGARPIFLFHCVRLFLAPRARSQVARAAHRAQPSEPPSRATELGRPAVGPLAVRLKPRQRYPTAGRPLGARTLRRHGSIRPRGGVHHHPRSRMKRSRGPATEPPGPDFNVSSRRVGVSNRQAGASGHGSRDRGDPVRGPGRGFGDAVSCGHRGAPAWDALLGRGRGSLGAQRAGASKRRGDAHVPGKTRAVTQ